MGGRTIPDLTPTDVRALASALDIPVGDDDVAEITHRLNAFVHALAQLGRLPLTPVESVPVDPTRIA